MRSNRFVRATVALAAAVAMTAPTGAAAVPAAGAPPAAQQPLPAGEEETSFSILPPYDGSDTSLWGCWSPECSGSVTADAATGRVRLGVTARRTGVWTESKPLVCVGGRPPIVCVPRPHTNQCIGGPIQARGSVTARHELDAPASSLQVRAPVAVDAGLLASTDPCTATSGGTFAEWSFAVTAESGTLDEQGDVLPGTRRTCQATSSTHRWAGPAAAVTPGEVLLTAVLVPPAGEVVAPGPLTVEVRLFGRAAAAAQTNVTRVDLSGTVTRIDGVAGGP